MAIILALFSALAYGISDFAGGLGSRKSNAGFATLIVQFFGFITALIAVALLPATQPSTQSLVWGALSGIGSATGALALYRGMVVGKISVVAPLSAVITAVLPVIIGLLLGESLPVTAQVGIALAIPSIILVALHSSGPEKKVSKLAGVPEGIISGIGFAFLFIALDQANHMQAITQSSAWPLVPGQLVAVLLVAPFAWRARSRFNSYSKLSWTTWGIIVAGGVSGGMANLLFLLATGYGQLALISVLTALYPAATILLARIFLAERLTKPQLAGLFMAAVAVILLSL